MNTNKKVNNKTENEILVSQKKNDWKKLWWVILLVELIGTFLLTLWIILPNTMAFTSPDAHSHLHWFWNVWSKIWYPFFMKALWAGLFVIAIVYAFRSISVNFNPAITIAEIGKKHDTPALGAMKMTVQMIGGILAGFAAFGIANLMNTWTPTVENGFYHTNLDSVIPYWNTYRGTTTLGEMNGGQGFFICFSMFLEFFYTFMLIASVFYFHKWVSHRLRPVFVGFMVTVLVALGCRTGNISINPARMFGPALAHDTMARATGLFSEIQYFNWVWFYLLAQIASGVVFAGIEMHKRQEI